MKLFILMAVLLISSCQSSLNFNNTANIIGLSVDNTNHQTITTEQKKFGSLNLSEKAALANEQAVRLEHSKFTKLPQEIVKNLEKRKCTIPQIWHDENLHNVISGEFSRKGQKDWAVLCSVNKISSILIFWNSSTTKVSEIAKSDDLDYFQGFTEDDEMGFSRGIDTVDKKYIIDHYNSYGGTKPPQIDHEGISDAFVEKASHVLYLHRGKWLELQGAD